MPIVNRISAFHQEMTDWRHDLHRHPETAFEEFRTSDFVAEKLEQFGIEVHRGLAKTGVVGTLKAGAGNRAIGLRADMDALHITELNDFDHRSVNDGKMHACGHDGHTTMLLGAAKYLSESPDFDGTVHFIFQPAEENEAGGRVMVQDGLFELFPVEAVFGMHNMPGIETGKIAARVGPQMASADFFHLKVKGVGGHGAMPHLAADPVVVAAEIVGAWQSIVSRRADPIESAVISVTMIHGGDTTNVIPEQVELQGTARAFRPEMQVLIEESMRRIAEGICGAHGLVGEFIYERRYPPTINTGDETKVAMAAAANVVGQDNVDPNVTPVMGSEDFGWMLMEKPGCYVFVGNGTGETGGCMVHNPNYDFNDEILPVGASYWVELVRTVLPAA
ncbi:MAG: M20 family metallopeptidase [Minwuiales bacterium]|nr:M20 family metallopeptidase [Minwuiales bacterium]